MREIVRKSLKKRTLGSIVRFAVVTFIATCIIIGLQYYYAQMNIYSDRAFSLTRTAAELIDGDRVQSYIDTGEKDEYYLLIQDFINAAGNETDLMYYYVFVPLDDEIIYVWDAEDKEGALELGYHETYGSETFRENVTKVMCQDPPEEISLEKDESYGFVASAYTPIFNSAGDAVAVAAVDFSMPDFGKNLIGYILIAALFILALTVLAQGLFYITVDERVLGPISKLTKSAEQIVGNLESDSTIDIDIKTGDEIEELANAFTRMDSDLRAYIRELSEVTAEKERIGTELNIAKRMQSGMLPNIFPPFPERKEFGLYASMVPAKEVGGDFYDFFLVDNDHIALVIADVSGKGVPAALFMVISKVLIKNSVQAGLTPAEALDRVNAQLLENNDSGMFVTVWLAVIDINTGIGMAANAGHEHPALKRNNGDYELIKYKHSPAVSALEGVQYKEHGFELEPGDCIFVYTDGITEATNKETQLFGEERLTEALNRHRDEPPEQLLPSIGDEIEGFVDGAPQFDDITMLCFRYNGRQ